ncbi:MAG: peptidoglycan editing factor PgeF [Rickettsiales bacterium]|nr:peptidoglycan editing factor PgeF [Pseudomonadota bacterium]MDA0966349.1 peptidoglycan editing factor PgeF [Pseudomonadota bacterium]MDG4543981.1 peptidoglycan editing factor PgeF [Rickettsiales bacterium]MDG4545475.1 peptidoglycan editing factor PgeF [Rickettsiales bacterium]MDG4547924.1 peptidoglycan editing factor PgeF [Rickettsiales bacterium]
MKKTPKTITCQEFSKQNNIVHAFFTRHGGVSEGIYSSLNLGAGSNDHPKNIEKNRLLAMAHIGYEKENLHTLYQIHSDSVIVVEGNFKERKEADAMVTKSNDTVLGILTADCTPVMFADNENKVIGAAHAGWKGTISGILQNTIEKMEELGADIENIQAVIGPTIGQKSYEVGKEFYDRFISKSPENTVFFMSSEKPQHYMFNLSAYVEYQLKHSGIKSVTNVNMDTYTDEDNFFSYRRSCHRKESDYGRNLSVIALKS